MADDVMRIIEAELNALGDAVRNSGGPRELTHEIIDAVDKLAGGGVTGERELLDLMQSVVRISKPPVLSTEWEEAWGNIFSHLISLILTSESGSGTVISHLFGKDPLPEAAGDERVLCINTGSTSTKLALFRGTALEAAEEVHLPPDFEDTAENRADAIIGWFGGRGVGPGELTGISCRGGFIKPVPTGTYTVCEEMLSDLEEPRIDHASNMAIPIGLKLKEQIGGGDDLLVTMNDPVASDEVETVSRITGIGRILLDGAGAHYLNQRAVHRLVCSLLGFSEKDLMTVGAHMGGGISIVRHTGGEIVDLVNAFSGVASANRCGNVPLDALSQAIDSGELRFQEVRRYMFGEGGLIDLTGTNDFRALLHFRDSGAVHQQREKIELVVDFMARSIAGAIMKLSAVEGAIDVVILTGGLSRSAEFTGRIRKRLFPYFPAVTVPGSLEHEAMVAGHMMARFKPETLKIYRDESDGLRRRRSEEKTLLGTQIFTHPQLRRKENAPVTSLDEVIHMARTMVAKYRAPRMAIVGAENEDAIEAAKHANEDGRYPIAKFLLVGDFYGINKLAWQYDIKIDGDNYTIVDTDRPVDRAVELLDSGEADLLMKGGVKTEQIMRGTIRFLKRSGRLIKGKAYSHVGFFQIPSYPKLLLVTDAALIPDPDQEMKKKILENALTVAGYLNITKPKVAVISAIESPNPSVESSMLAREFADAYSEREDCIVEGPVSLDVAMDPHSAREKNYGGAIRGNADILLMPDIEAGNVVYKSLTVSSGAYLAGAIVGGGVPIVLTSRGDSARSKLASISLACIVALKQGDISPAG